jgi:PAS domain S-box-containing protein
MQLLDEARNRRNQIKKLELQNLRNNRIFHLVLIFLLAVIILLIHLRYIKIKRTKFALREREKKFRMLAENAAEVIWSSDLNLNLTYISPSAEKIFGYPRQERMGKLMSDVFSSSSVRQMHSLLNQQLARIQTNKHKAEPLTIELKGFHINGREVWVEVTASLIFDHNGRPSGLQGTAREISRRKETELKMIRMLEDMNRQDKELREQNAALLLARKEYEEVADKYYDLFENGPVGYVILDEQGLVTGMNSAASMMVGHNSDEVRSKPFSEFVHQHQRAQFSSLLNDTLGSRQVNQQEFKISDITAKMVFVPDTIGGSKKCRLALVDVTGEVKVREELSLALQSMKTVFDAIPAGLTVVDKDYRVVNMNKWLQDIHHFEKQSVYLGKKCFEIFNCGKRPCSGCIWGQVYQTHKTIIRNSSPDDPVYKKGQFRIYSSPMFDRSGRIIGIVEMVMDISDLKKAESALKDSERKFKELFNDIPDAVFITGIGDESGKIIDVNPAAELQTGYSREELLTMNVLTDISEYNEGNNMTADREQQLISDNKIKLTERKQRKDGSFIWSEVVVQKIVIDGKKHALSVSRDISERVRIQEHLKESEARIRSLLSAIPDILFVFDREGHFLEYHSDTDDKLIMPPERFLNRKVNEILPDQLAKLTKKKIEETFSTGRMQMYEYDIDTPDGKNYFDVRMVKASEDTVLTIVRDITDARRAEKDKKQNEEKFKTLFLNTPLGVFNFNENSVILNCNANFEKIIGSDSNVLIGFNILKQSKDNELKQAVYAALKNGTGYYEGNYRSVTSGKITPVKAFFKSIYDHHGNFVDGIGIVEDVTEQKKYEANLLKALKRAEQSDRLKSSFMATMSHELRTPLNTVIGFSDMIEEDMPIDQVLEFTQVISKSGRYLLSIIEDILDISLIDSGEAKMLVERFMISDLMNRLYNDASREKVILNKDHLSIKVKYPDSMQDIKLSGDIRKINKVFLHLIRNALKFTKKGEIEIGARPVSESDANVEVLFYVKDTGIGIPDEKHDLIFEIFRQGDDSRTREFEGTGLGLSISRKLIHLMGGTIHLESEPGKGSTFSFQLPVRAGAAKDVNARPGNIKPELKITTGITVLVAEDDDTNFHLFRLLLNRKKLEVIRAKNGEEALKEVSQNKDVALVLMDINMPVMNGYEATRQIKKLREDLPVIAVTAYAMTGDRIMAEEAGCDDYITKPINNTIFYETIEKYLI